MSNPTCNEKITSTTPNCCGLRDTLAVILRLQENAEDIGDETLDTCDRPFLGPQPTTKCFNTRPIMLYTCDNKMWEIPIDDDCPSTITTTDTITNCPTTSNVFRLEKLGSCTATFRVLIATKKGNNCVYRKTNTFFTINLCCLAAIRCLPDTYISGC